MLKVLILDADSNFATVLGRALVKAGHETRIVGDAKYGIVRAKAFQPDLVLMDLNIPGVTGTQLIEEVKPLVPGRIVICGTSTDPEQVKAVITAGASDYVLKSSSIEDILARTCPTEDSADSSSDSESEDEPEDDSYEEKQGENPKKALISQLRAPLRDGKRPFCVIVAHPEEEKRAFITEIIERLNQSLHVIGVSTSEQAIAACAGNRAVMLVIDWETPNIPARQAMKTIAEAKNGKAIGVFVTNKSNSPEKQRVALYSGAMAFAHEPWDDGSLEGQLRHVLDVIRKRRRKARIMAARAKAS